jgi:hypothetical protein
MTPEDTPGPFRVLEKLGEGGPASVRRWTEDRELWRGHAVAKARAQ